MKIFTYRIDYYWMDAIRWHFGEAQYVDVSEEYLDIFALPADVVIINVDKTGKDIVDIIQEYENETKYDSNTQYYYVRESDFDKWMEEYFKCLDKEIYNLAKDISKEEYTGLELFRIQKILSGTIYNVIINDNESVCYEYYRSEMLENAKLSITKESYNNIDNRYRCLRELYEYHCELEDIPITLQSVYRKLQDQTSKCRYACFGE